MIFGSSGILIIAFILITIFIILIKKICQERVSWTGLCIFGVLLFIIAGMFNPEYLTRHRRSSGARVRADMRSIATAIESYYVDHKAYPLNQSEFYRITTPIPFITSIPDDPFRKTDNRNFGYHMFASEPDQKPYWILDSFGPDEDSDLQPYLLKNPAPRTYQDLLDITYDSSNGTMSNGDVFRFYD